MVETGSRDGFIIRPLEYFEKMYDNLAPEHMKLLMAYYDNEPISGVYQFFMEIKHGIYMEQVVTNIEI